MSNRVALLTIVSREVLRFMRIWLQTLLPPVVVTALYFIIFGNLIGPRIGRMDGFDYSQFIMPGLVMMAVITNSYSNVVSSFYSAKFHRSIEEMLISPMPGYLILLGYTLGGVLRGLVVGVLVMAVALLFTELRVEHVWITVIIVVLTATLFSIGGFINALFAKSFDDISIVPTFVLAPLTYLGGVFYSIDMLSPFWRQISLANPILYMVNGFRYGILGVSDIGIGIAIGLIVVMVLLAFGVALALLERGVGIRS
ncbi:MAG TPA: ABC transporter permease [Gammaproteobacteria bacterium]|nr:ABC transporter permease [Gammaproteobacteria bacterium]